MYVPKLVGDFTESVVRLLYPPCCRACAEPLEEDDPLRLCPGCIAKLDLIEGTICDQCGHPLVGQGAIHGGRCRNCPEGTLYYASVRSALAYGDSAKALIHAFKFRFHRGLAPYLAAYLTPPYWRRFQNETDVMVPVPLHWFRRRWREFNQSEELAQPLGEKVNVPVEPGCLKRMRWTRTQSRLRSPSAKRQNVFGAFKVVKPEVVRGKAVLLVDDVFTTGHTVNECARILMESGACVVNVLTLSRVVHSD